MLSVVARAERLGLTLGYITDVDLHADFDILDGARAVFFGGHDEYWSREMREAVTAARDRGVNVAFLGANSVFRRIRFEDSQLGPHRIEVNYKRALLDPLYGKDDEHITADWREPPRAEPESSLTGSLYDCFKRGRSAGVVAAPDHFLFAGASVTRGQKLPGLIGPEIDRVMLEYPTPRPIQVLLRSPFRCPDHNSYADTTYYTTESGAGVFNAATLDWVDNLRSSAGNTDITTKVVRTVTDNLLRAFAAGRAGVRHPAVDNLASLGISRS
jgi:hypothetical protein